VSKFRKKVAPRGVPALDRRSVLTDISVMTETTVTKDLPPAVRHFILSWGDMGGVWGMNRSVCQIQALLYLSETPLTAEEIAETLGMARSNVSNSIKELQAWGLIRRAPILGDRRDRFMADTDVWSIAAKIVQGRKARELDPALTALTACVEEAERDSKVGAAVKTRLAAMRDFTRAASHWYEQMACLPQPKLMMMLRLGGRIMNFLPTRKAK
jgi:DNA-binding transcriptional regulator GbsR (MarR family)